MARSNLNAYGDLIPVGAAMEMPAYLEAVRVAGLVPRRWLDARHAGVIVVQRDENGIVVVSRGAE